MTAVDCRLSRPGPDVLLRADGVQRLIPWGHRWQAGTPAHWVALAEAAAGDPRGAHRHRLGTTLREEVAACLLGGFGLPYETGLAAFAAVRDRGLLADGARPSAADVEAVLQEPLDVDGRRRRYRFPVQRGARLAAALAYLDTGDPPRSPLAVRDWLLHAPGIGPKTASWIVRNRYGSDDIAVLDVHVLRAGVAAGVFDATWSVQRQYRLIEGFFLSWARHGRVSAGDLDAVIWAEQAAAARARVRARPGTPAPG